MGNKTTFHKPPLTYLQQLQLLKERGLSIEDENQAMFVLSHVNYYRLTSYWIPFQTNVTSHSFKTGTAFSQIIELYDFDKELRLLIFEAIEKIEVSIRAKWAYELALRYGSHAHLNHQITKSSDLYNKDTNGIKKAVEQSKEIFIQHHLKKYHEASPPIWVVSEVLSLGLLSRLYNNLDDITLVGFKHSAKEAIANAYTLDFSILESWLHALTQIRNFSAHHARVWNREFTVTPKLVRSKPSILKGQFEIGSRKLYNVLVIILYLLDQIDTNHTLRKRFKQLLLAHQGYLPQMGFPTDWHNKTIWH
jgi:abortive infection bacteriophage resistance protein